MVDIRLLKGVIHRSTGGQQTGHMAQEG